MPWTKSYRTLRKRCACSSRCARATVRPSSNSWLSTGPHNFFNSAFTSIKVTEGTGGGDFIYVLALDRPATIQGGGGNQDAVLVGKSGYTTYIHQPLTVTNPPSGAKTGLWVDDSADPSNHNMGTGITIDQGAITGLAQAAINDNQNDLSFLEVDGGSGINTYNVNNTPTSNSMGGLPTTLKTGYGSNTVNIERTTGPLVVYLHSHTGQSSTANVSPTAKNLNTIQGAVTVHMGGDGGTADDTFVFGNGAGVGGTIDGGGRHQHPQLRRLQHHRHR